MTKEEIINGLKKIKEWSEIETHEGFWETANEAIEALEQEPITWIVGKDNCQVAVRNMPIDKMQKICAIIGEEKQRPKTIQEELAESEKYQKAFDDGYENGYAQARFDYEQQSCESMRDATEEERKSTKDYIDSISKPTGLQFDDIYEELDFVQPHKQLSVNLHLWEDCISREEAKQFLYERIDRLNDDELYDIFSRIIDDMYNELPPVTPRPKGKWIGHKKHCENLGVMPSGLGAYNWCSNCDCGIDVVEFHRNHYNFCPNCGAKMESEDKE